jgi:ribosomal protein L19
VAKLRKRPKPADAEPESKAEPAAQDVTVLPPVPAPPPVEHKPIIVAEAMIPCPRTPEEIIHNVIMRQLEDDVENPPEPEPGNPLVALLKKVQNAKDTGLPLAAYADEAAKHLQGLDAEEKLTAATVRHVRLREICEGLETRTAINRFLRRLFKRGDFNAREALVFKQLTDAQLETQIKAMLDGIKTGNQDAVTHEDFMSMDWSLKMTEKASAKAFEGITPQEREIVRKITITARRKIYGDNIE